MSKVLHVAGGALLFAFFLLVPYALSSKVSVGQDGCVFTIEGVIPEFEMQSIEYRIVTDPKELKQLVIGAAIASGKVLNGEPTRAITAVINGNKMVGFEYEDGCLTAPIDLGPV